MKKRNLNLIEKSWSDYNIGEKINKKQKVTQLSQRGHIITTFSNSYAPFIVIIT